MQGEGERTDAEAQYDSAYVNFRRRATDLRGTPGSDTFRDWDDLGEQAQAAMKSAAEDLLAAAAKVGPAAHGEAVQSVADFTPMNQNDARKALSSAEAEAEFEDLTFHAVTKLVTEDPDRDAVYVVDVETPPGRGVIRAGGDELLSVSKFRERLLEAFDYVGLTVKNNDWLDYLGGVFEDLAVEVETRDPTLPEHMVAQAVVKRISQSEVTVSPEQFGEQPTQTIFYDRDSDPERALLASRVVDHARDRGAETPSADAVKAVLQSRGLVFEEDPIEEWGDGYSVTWAFDPVGLIEQGVVPGAVFEDPEGGHE